MTRAEIVPPGEKPKPKRPKTIYLDAATVEKIARVNQKTKDPEWLADRLRRVIDAELDWVLSVVGRETSAPSSHP